MGYLVKQQHPCSTIFDFIWLEETRPLLNWLGIDKCLHGIPFCCKPSLEILQVLFDGLPHQVRPGTRKVGILGQQSASGLFLRGGTKYIYIYILYYNIYINHVMYIILLSCGGHHMKNKLQVASLVVDLVNRRLFDPGHIVFFALIHFRFQSDPCWIIS